MYRATTKDPGSTPRVSDCQRMGIVSKRNSAHFCLLMWILGKKEGERPFLESSVQYDGVNSRMRMV
jgi:hypothetical protein